MQGLTLARAGMGVAKCAVLSTLSSVTPASPFVFRNYEHPPAAEPLFAQVIFKGYGGLAHCVLAWSQPGLPTLCCLAEPLFALVTVGAVAALGACGLLCVPCSFSRASVSA